MFEFKLLVLIIVANGSPIVAQKLFGKRWQTALDGGYCLSDGKPLFGPTKRWRGLLSACLLTPVFAWVMQFSFVTGLIIALSAMLGDLCSSFIKRRLGMGSSSMALGLDQIPESLFPLLCLKLLSAHFPTHWLPELNPVDLSWSMIAQIVLIFFIIELVLSKILFHLHIRNQPY